MCAPAAVAAVNGHERRASPVMSGADHLSLLNPAEHITGMYVHADDVTFSPFQLDFLLLSDESSRNGATTFRARHHSDVLSSQHCSTGADEADIKCGVFQA